MLLVYFDFKSGTQQHSVANLGVEPQIKVKGIPMILFQCLHTIIFLRKKRWRFLFIGFVVLLGACGGDVDEDSDNGKDYYTYGEISFENGETSYDYCNDRHSEDDPYLTKNQI